MIFLCKFSCFKTLTTSFDKMTQIVRGSPYLRKPHKNLNKWISAITTVNTAWCFEFEEAIAIMSWIPHQAKCISYWKRENVTNKYIEFYTLLHDAQTSDATTDVEQYPYHINGIDNNRNGQHIYSIYIECHNCAQPAIQQEYSVNNIITGIRLKWHIHRNMSKF